MPNLSPTDCFTNWETATCKSTRPFQSVNKIWDEGRNSVWNQTKNIQLKQKYRYKILYSALNISLKQFQEKLIL